MTHLLHETSGPSARPTSRRLLAAATLLALGVTAEAQAPLADTFPCTDQLTLPIGTSPSGRVHGYAPAFSVDDPTLLTEVEFALTDSSFEAGTFSGASVHLLEVNLGARGQGPVGLWTDATFTAPIATETIPPQTYPAFLSGCDVLQVVDFSAHGIVLEPGVEYAINVVPELPGDTPILGWSASSDLSGTPHYFYNDGSVVPGAGWYFIDHTRGPAVRIHGDIQASETVRVGSPPNPNVFLPGQTSGPVLGQVWDPVVDHTTFFPTALLDVAVISTFGPIQVPTQFGTLLCIVPTDPSLIHTSLPGVPFSVAIPPSTSLAGLPLTSQAAGFRPGDIRLTNALDLILGG